MNGMALAAESPEGGCAGHTPEVQARQRLLKTGRKGSCSHLPVESLGPQV